MSKAGIKKVAKVFQLMQETRNELIQMASPKYVRGRMPADATIDKQDLRLAHMLEDGKDAMKDVFAKETLRKD